MSTKTTFKRIALVAVAALGLGVLSVAPSSAAVISTTVTAGSAGATAQLTSTTVSSDSTTGTFVTVQSLFGGAAGESTSVTFVQKSAPTGATVAARMLFVDTNGSTTARVSKASDSLTGTLATKLNQADSFTAANGSFWINNTGAAGYAGGLFSIALESATATAKAGTYVYTVIATNYTAGNAQTAQFTADVSIVVSALASTATTVDATKLSAYIGSSSGATSDSNISAVATADATTDAYITVKIANASGDTTTALDSVTATVTGSGVISFDGTNWGKSIKYSATGNAVIQVRGDGVAGTASIAVSTLSGLSATKTMSFYAKDAKTITPSVFTPLLTVGANDSAVAVTAVDSNGTNWTGALYIYPVAAADALVSGAITAAVACVASSDKTKQYCPLTTKTTGTASFKVGNNADPSLATVTSDAVKVTVSNATPATVKLAFDKATYGPGEKAVVTVTPLDSTGAALQAQSSAALLSSAGITSNIAVTLSTTTGLTSTVLSGTDAVAISTAAYAGTDKTAGSFSIVVYMPQASGTVTLTGKGGSALPLSGQVAVTASATVVNASVDAATDAANEATDAANAATDAALAAADAADAATAAAQDASDAVAALSASVEKLVASLKAQITSLTNLVIKIQKKVKA